MSNEKSQAALLKEKLFSNPKNGWLRVNDSEKSEIFSFCDGYVEFLGKAKTERLFCKYAEEFVKSEGFVPFEKGKKYAPGDKVYYVNHKKSLILCVFGKKPLCEGVRIAAAHIDSPRLDLKQHPLYEDTDLAYFKTHYYGGIRKYQWPTVPLSLHGTIVRADGEVIDVNIGEDEGDPVFVVTDLLPHLAVEQSKRTLSDGIRGEELNILVGGLPFAADGESELVKLNVLKLLNEKYGITEDDFVSAELEAVPAAKPRDVGFDRSLIGAYGHDDRVCAYPAMMAAVNCRNPERTTVTVLTDKEETGSDGNTGLQSAYLKNFIYDIAGVEGVDGYEVIAASECLSADVNAAFDPTFADAFEKRNASLASYGAVITKYTGARGKGDTSDASAEFTGKIRLLMDKNNVVWQTGELGKVDGGGGGTVAKYIANLGADVIDLGVPVLSMHAPFEVVSKIDVYMVYRAVYVFYDEK